MDVLTALEKRRSIRNFDTNYRLTEDEVNGLTKAAVMAPTSYNIQHGRIVRVTDGGTKQALREAAFDQAQVSEASEVWLICADTQAWQKDPNRYWRDADQSSREMLVGMLTNFYHGKPDLQHEEAIRTGAFIGQSIMLMATSLGLASGPMIGFDAAKVARIVNLPEDHVIVMMVVIGKGTKPPFPRGGFLSEKEVVLHNKF